MARRDVEGAGGQALEEGNAEIRLRHEQALHVWGVGAIGETCVGTNHAAVTYQLTPRFRGTTSKAEAEKVNFDIRAGPVRPQMWCVGCM